MSLDVAATRALRLLLVSLSLGGTAIVAAVALVALLGHPERADALIYFGGLGIALPLGFLIAGRLADRGPQHLAPISVALPAGLAALLVASRLTYGFGATTAGSGWLPLVGSLVLLGAAFPLARWGGAKKPALGDAGGRGALAAGIALVVAGLLVCAPPHDLSPRNLGLSLLVALALGAAYARIRPRRPARGRRLVFDVVVALLIVLVAIDVIGYLPAAPDQSSLQPGALVSVVQRNYDFYLGAANDVLHGRAVLVGSASQYGVGAIYVLAAWFSLAPLGYGTVMILVGLLTAMQYVAAWMIMRIAGCGPLLAFLAAVVAIGVTLLPGTDPVLAPSQSGLRFLLPFVAGLLALRAASRSSDRAVSIPVLAVTGLSSIWSLETFVYTAASVVAVAAVDAAIRFQSTSGRIRALGGDLGRIVAACVGTHIAFAIGTRLLAGDWPDWGWYLAYFSNTYSPQGFTSVPVGAWSPGLFVAGFYFASLAGLAVLIRAEHETARRERLALLGIAALSAAGFAMLTYWVGRSVDVTLPLLSLPAVAASALWLALLLRLGAARRTLQVVIASVWAWIGALLVIAASGSAAHSWDRTALAHLLPGGRPLRGDLEALWDSPPMDPRVREAQRLIKTRFPDSDRALVIIETDLGVEALIRTGRINQLPISDPSEDTVAISHSLPRVSDAVDRLNRGTLMLIQHHPAGPKAPMPTVAMTLDRSGGLISPERWLSPLQLKALGEIKDRFTLRPVARGRYGLTVVRLAEPPTKPRPPS